MSIKPEDLTGAMVTELRKKYRLTVAELYEICGWEGRSTSRLSTIETKNKWREGDRERVAAAFDRLEIAQQFLHSQATSITPNSASEGVTSDAPGETGDASVSSVSDDGAGVLPDPDISPVEAASAPAPSSPGYDPHDVSSNWWNAAPGSTVASTAVVDITSFAQDDNSYVAFDLTEDIEDETTAERLVTMEKLGLTEQAAQDGALLMTNGQLRTYDRCKRKWWLAWYRRLALARESVLGVRSTGTRIHRALEAYYVPDGQTPTSPQDALERVIVEDWTAVRAQADELGWDESQLAELEKKFQDSASLERAMIEGYVEYLAETGIDSELKVIGSETTVSADLDVDGHLVRVAALIDSRVERRTDGARLFIDHKSVQDLKNPHLTLPMNPQMLHYHLVEWLKTPDGEKRCDGALYNMLRRVKRTGRATPPFYDRVEVRHNDLQLESYRRHLVSTTRQIMSTIQALDAGQDPHDVAPPNPMSSCSWDCDFLPVCTMFDDGSHAEDAVAGLYHQIDPHDRYDRELKGSTE
jgi:hypothetical protein